ncbi:GNAT family N-acetyltransferase [Candidatus Phyllobacterium onerii]|jgi:GNAT superfamily N-acetyltransferase|uniref:GNAT family N-acetyltransferase n=1 Tax=Candidatus Phyllobacterium onerii TaxID=3020828 RepID=UPI00232D9C0A|nr:GNAT family N-acetyltransferase [Phyllobacterium sp. IY22]
MMIIRAAKLRDMSECAEIVNAWIDATKWMPRVHPKEDVAEFYRDTVFSRFQVFVAENDNHVAGMVALAPDNTVSALYVRASERRTGVGKALLDHAKKEAGGPVELWAFVANRDAQAFYEREGFKEIRRTEGDNEEKLPDILYRWQPVGPETTP